MTTSWKLAMGLAAALLLAITSSVATAYLMRPPMPKSEGSPARTDPDVPPERDGMAEPRRGIVDYVRTPPDTPGGRRR
jgi:hypothetical protein